MAVPCALPKERMKRPALLSKRQKTLGKAVSISGTGLFTGEKTKLTIQPAEPNTGIVFQRTDLVKKPFFSASIEHVINTPRCTVLGKEKCAVSTVEHILSALRGLEIDNAWLELSGSEVPILDGSTEPFIDLFERAGTVLQETEKKVYSIQTPFYWSQGDVHLIALPSDHYRISYTLHYPHSSIIGSQFFSLEVTPDHYKTEIAPSRTFCLYEEIAPLIQKGLLKGGSLDNAVIIKEGKLLNEVRFPDEMVRHKILDVIGDLSLIPHLHAHIIAIRSGHHSNVAFAKELWDHIKRGNAV